jgi:ribosomal protein S18 acetylase RimI-like enzyme
MTNEEQIVIRAASPQDAETIAALTDAAYSKYIPRLGRKPQPMTADYRQVVAKHAVWLLCMGDQPAGVLVLMREPEAMLIYSVAISPEVQKRGLGRRLLAWAEQQARQAGYALIRLYTNERMQENIAWYQRLGYQETHREPLQGSRLVHLARRLAS